MTRDEEAAMPSKSFALERGGPKRVIVSWKAFWREVCIAVDGEEVLRVADQRALQAGASRALPNGSVLSIKLRKTFITPELVLTCDGVPLPGSSTDPAAQVKLALGLLQFFAGSGIVLGLVAEIFRVQWLKEFGLGVASIVEGCVYAVLAFFVSRGSRTALAVGIGLFLLDGISIVVVAISNGVNPVGGLITRILFAIWLVRGFTAMRSLNDANARQPATSIDQSHHGGE
jgi:hypothetical protein